MSDLELLEQAVINIAMAGITSDPGREQALLEALHAYKSAVRKRTMEIDAELVRARMNLVTYLEQERAAGGAK